MKSSYLVYDKQANTILFMSVPPVGDFSHFWTVVADGGQRVGQQNVLVFGQVKPASVAFCNKWVKGLFSLKG